MLKRRDMKILETPRLIIRGWELNDADDLFDYAQSDQVGPNAGWLPHKDVEESRRIIQMFRADAHTYALVLKAENRVIGSIGLHKRKPDEPDWSFFRKQMELGFALSYKYWGQGIVPEAVKEILRFAFEELKLDEIYCGHFDFNAQSKRVIEKTGFTYDHTLTKKIETLNNEERTIIFYKMSRKDYYRIKREEAN